eukprot:GEMP01082978.1.p2 GENE.GEMP01082978.1~~GEMP01082978.1.p2  ORF type:complete len:131 (-),score=11.08 GEMP01082978.1:391-783(-)
MRPVFCCGPHEKKRRVRKKQFNNKNNYFLSLQPAKSGRRKSFCVWCVRETYNCRHEKQTGVTFWALENKKQTVALFSQAREESTPRAHTALETGVPKSLVAPRNGAKSLADFCCWNTQQQITTGIRYKFM